MHSARKQSMLIVMLLWSGSIVHARSLIGAVRLGAPNDIVVQGQSVTGEIFGDVLQKTVFRGIDFPLTSTSPGFSFRYDPVAKAFERLPNLGSVLTERPETIGRGRFDLGASTVYGKLDQLNGKSLSEYEIGLATDSGALFTRLDDFDLEGSQTSITGTYGITDDWDVNLVVPLVWTRLRTNFVGRVSSAGGAVAPRRHIDEEAFGVGDIAVRTKYRLFEYEGFSAAAQLGLQLPSGNEDNFQGTGDVLVTPMFVAGYDIGPHNVHLNAGLENDANDPGRSRARYALGASLQVVRDFAFLVDIIGSSDLESSEARSHLVPSFSTSISRKDLVDLSMIFKVGIVDRAVAFAGVIVPLTDDGLRADVLPLGGVQVPF